MFLAPVEPD